MITLSASAGPRHVSSPAGGCDFAVKKFQEARRLEKNAIESLRLKRFDDAEEQIKKSEAGLQAVIRLCRQNAKAAKSAKELDETARRFLPRADLEAIHALELAIKVKEKAIAAAGGGGGGKNPPPPTADYGCKAFIQPRPGFPGEDLIDSGDCNQPVKMIEWSADMPIKNFTPELAIFDPSFRTAPVNRDSANAVSAEPNPAIAPNGREEEALAVNSGATIMVKFSPAPTGPPQTVAVKSP